MFSISTKGDYGLLILSDIAQQQRAGKLCVSLSEIAEKKKLSLKYISQIATILKEAGFITSKEGKGGGYSLAKKPTEISLMQVLEALEGPVAPVKCSSEQKDLCHCEASCGMKNTWQGATTLLKDYLSSKTLADTL